MVFERWPTSSRDVMDIRWSTKRFDELTVHELHDLLRLRVDIFVVEQACVYAEIDGQDPAALHLFAQATDGAMIAYARILPPDSDGLPHIGRIVVRADHRGKGVATDLMMRAMENLRQHYGSRRSALAAQAHLVAFYERFGFVRQGPDHLLDGIPHVDMRREEA